jgi:hypothetical protein
MKQQSGFCLLVLPTLLLAACSAKFGTITGADSSPRFFSVAGIDRGIAVTQAESKEEALPAADEAEAPLQDTLQRKLVKRANLSIRVEDLAAADASVNALMEQHGAYASSTEISENSRSYVIRVPHRAYEAFLAGMSGMGRTLRRSESAEDVTVRYYDLAGRLATKQALLETYRSYLGKAKDIEEILSVEARIAELQNEIDGTGKELRRLASLVDFAAVELDIYGPAASVSNSGPALGERIKELFSAFGGFVSTALVVLLGMVIYGIPVMLILVLLFWILFGRIGLLKKIWHIAAGKK